MACLVILLAVAVIALSRSDARSRHEAFAATSDTAGTTTPPFATAPAASALDDPTSAAYTPGQETILRSGDGKLAVRMPPGALSETATVEYRALVPMPSTSVQVFRQFDLTAHAGTEPARPIRTFDAPLTLTLHYDDDEVRGLDYRTYTLAYFNETEDRWEPLPTEHDVANRVLTAQVDHFSIFAGQANPAYALQGMVQNFQANLNAGSAVFSYPFQLPPVPGDSLPGIALVYDSSAVNETKNHRDVASWVGTGWDVSLPHIFYNDELSKYFLSLNGIQGELVQNSDGTWYTRSDSNLKIERSPGVATSSAKSAGTGADAGGGSATWSNPGNITGSDDSRATAAYPNPSNNLDATNFGLSIPSGATINGVQVSIEKGTTVNSGATVTDTTVRLLKAGAVVGDNKASGTAWPIADANATYGGSSDLWGTSWTAGDFTPSGFGVRISASQSGGDSSHTIAVDHVRITVYFTPETPDVFGLFSTKSAGTGADVDDCCGGPAWSNPGNITSSNDASAQVTAHVNYASDSLQATNFAFAIPSAATISGIEVQIERRASAAGIRDGSLQLLKAGGVAGVDKRDNSVDWPSTDTVRTYGGPTDRWGVSWTPADINASNFGAALMIGAAPNSPLAYVDHIQIKVYYADLPSWWTVRTRDGTTYEFGGGGAWNQYIRNPGPRTWRYDLRAVTDVHGNSATTTFA
ncbi:MAG: hypothetical protein HY678_02910, partial [Chloroflexi bacterium]|nr:hypothetical protein [Chloroflexota bacterium]